VTPFVFETANTDRLSGALGFSPKDIRALQAAFRGIIPQLFSHSIKILKLPIIKNGWINVQDIFFVYPISYLPYFNKIKHKVLRAFLKNSALFAIESHFR
jgi:hypothetical protein